MFRFLRRTIFSKIMFIPFECAFKGQVRIKLLSFSFYKAEGWFAFPNFYSVLYVQYDGKLSIQVLGIDILNNED